MGQLLGKAIWHYLSKLTSYLVCDPAISFLQMDSGMCPRDPQEGPLSKVVHCCVISGGGEWEVPEQPLQRERESENGRCTSWNCLQ